VEPNLLFDVFESVHDSESLIESDFITFLLALQEQLLDIGALILHSTRVGKVKGVSFSDERQWKLQHFFLFIDGDGELGGAVESPVNSDSSFASTNQCFGGHWSKEAAGQIGYLVRFVT